MSPIEALYIFDEHNNLLFDHTYAARPSPPSILLPLYLQHTSPRPSCIYLPSLSPPALLYSIVHDNLLFISPTTTDSDPLLILEYLHRVVDAFEEFLGAPLLASKLTASFDVIAQIVAEIADDGIVCQGEANALRDTVETGPGVLKNLLGTIGATGSSPALQVGGPSGLRPQLQPAQSAQGSAVPWRRSNVRHTSNELYVDLVESLAVTVAPSGRPLSAFAHGSIAFTAKVSGVPDLTLNLATASGKGAPVIRALERAVFHPCVRLSKWEKDGVLSFVPPDGRFALCGYEVDLLGPDASLSGGKTVASGALNLPATIEVNTGLGDSGNEFEVRLSQPSSGISAARSSLQSNLGRPGAFRTGSGGDSKTPAIEGLTVHVPIPSTARNVPDIRPSKGEAQWTPADGCVEWRILTREFGPGGAVLRCTVQGQISDSDGDATNGATINGMTATTYDYDEDDGPSAYQSEPSQPTSSAPAAASNSHSQGARDIMPSSAMLSFNVKGWLASGLKVDSLLVDTNKSKGLGSEVRPYKGVKYLTTSRQGLEVRC